MNLNASAETIRNVAEMFKLASFLDDRLAAADQGRIAAWSEQVQRHNLTRDDILDGLQAFYDQPHQHAIGVGDLIHHARIAKRARLDREDDAARERLEAKSDLKAADDVAFTAAAISGRVKHRTPRLEAAEALLQTCQGKRAAVEAIREYGAALREAHGKQPRKATA